MQEYDILNFWNFPDGLGLQVKVGHFVPLAPRDQDFSIHEELIDWAFEFKEVSWTEFFGYIFMTHRYSEKNPFMGTLVISFCSVERTQLPVRTSVISLSFSVSETWENCI